MSIKETKEVPDLNAITGYNDAQKNKVKKDINKLDNDAFMKLFLEQLKNQDPTAPMETDKIITQTAQLTQVEMQEQTKQTMIEVANAMKSTQNTNEELKNFQSDMKQTLELLAEALGKDTLKLGGNSMESPYNSVGMIGKIAETKVNGLNITQNEPIEFEIYFDEPIDSTLGVPQLKIFDSQQNLVKEVDISNYNGKSGYVKFSLDTKDTQGNPLPSGVYNILANYNHKPNGTYNTARVGRGEVQSVLFDEGKSYLRMGELVVPLSEALEFYAKEMR